MNKIIKAATELQNNNTFIALEDDHGPRKTSTAINNKATITTTPDATPPSNRTYTFSERSLNEKEKQDRKLKRRMHNRQTLQRLAQQDDLFLKESITTAEDERTAMAKADKMEVRRNTIDKAHDQNNAKPTASITKHYIRNLHSIQESSHANPNKQKTSDVRRNNGASKHGAPHVRFRSRRTLCEQRR
jgi:hypothetical protein